MPWSAQNRAFTYAPWETEPYTLASLHKDFPSTLPGQQAQAEILAITLASFHAKHYEVLQMIMFGVSVSFAVTVCSTPQPCLFCLTLGINITILHFKHLLNGNNNTVPTPWRGALWGLTNYCALAKCSEVSKRNIPSKCKLLFSCSRRRAHFQRGYKSVTSVIQDGSVSWRKDMNV